MWLNLIKTDFYLKEGMINMKIAVVTGASSGIGTEFVKKLQKCTEFEQIWIIARRKERLLDLELKYGEKIVPIALDLTIADDLNKFECILKEKNPDIRLLINCAGFGRFGKYDQIAINDSMKMIDLNCKALVYMSEICIPYMTDGSKIIEVDSIAAFQPIPYLNVYGATKAFVMNYSLALDKELKSKNIRVFALCPGWTKTEFFNESGNENGAVTKFNKWFTAEQIADYALKKINKSKKVLLIPSFYNKVQAILVKFASKNFTMNVWLKQQKHK